MEGYEESRIGLMVSCVFSLPFLFFRSLRLWATYFRACRRGLYRMFSREKEGIEQDNDRIGVKLTIAVHA